MASSVAGAWEGVWVGLAEGRCSEKNEVFERLLLLQKRQVQGDVRKRKKKRTRHALLVKPR